MARAIHSARVRTSIAYATDKNKHLTGLTETHDTLPFNRIPIDE